MRNFLTRTGIAVLIAATGIFVLLRFDPSDNDLTAASDLSIQCAIQASALSVNAPKRLENATWNAFISDIHGTAPSVRLKRQKVPGISSDKQICVLRVVRLPSEPLDGTDWRLGHRIADMEGISGRSLRITMRLAASTPIRLSAGSAYSYDGINVRAVGIQNLVPEVQDFTWEHEVPQDAQFLEIWLRLSIHGTIEPAGDIYLVSTLLEPVSQ